MTELNDALVRLMERIDTLKSLSPIKRTLREPYMQALGKGISRLEKPTMITWNMTKACNLSCTYCAVDACHGKPRYGRDLRSKVLQRVIQLHPAYVSLLGGEPTFVPDLPGIVSSLSRSGIFVDITTNGTWITDELIGALREAQDTGLLIMISLDSHDPKTNDEQRGKGAYETAVRAAKLLGEAGISFVIGMTVTRKNLHHLRDTYLLAEKIGAYSFCSWFVMPAGRAKPEQVAVPDFEFIDQANWLLDKAQNGGLGIGRMDLSYATVRLLRSEHRAIEGNLGVAELVSRIECEGCRYKALIDENGDVFPCDFLQYPTFLMGNILKDTWEDIWNSPAARYKASISRRTKPGCRDCEALSCTSGCFGVSFAYYLRTGKLVPMCEVR